MNRKQAEHILDAYVKSSRWCDQDTADALKEVILDAMTEYKIQYQYLKPWNITSSTPSVTWSSGSGTTTISG